MAPLAAVFSIGLLIRLFRRAIVRTLHLTLQLSGLAKLAESSGASISNSIKSRRLAYSGGLSTGLKRMFAIAKVGLFGESLEHNYKNHRLPKEHIV